MSTLKRKAVPIINPSHLLLVEGEGDRGFFEQVCKKIAFSTEMPEIKIARPKDLQVNYENLSRDGKSNVLNVLKDLLPDFIEESSSIKRIAAVVDADYKISHPDEGYQKTLEKIKAIFEPEGFLLDENNNNGLILKNGGLSVGVWIMPNNQHEGMLEDFIKTCIHQNEQSLFNHVSQTIQAMSEPKFDKNIHLTKAEIATWLAWQKTPGHGFYATMTDNLLHTEHELFLELQNWLKQIFA